MEDIVNTFGWYVVFLMQIVIVLGCFFLIGIGARAVWNVYKKRKWWDDDGN